VASPCECGEELSGFIKLYTYGGDSSDAGSYEGQNVIQHEDGTHTRANTDPAGTTPVKTGRPTPVQHSLRACAASNNAKAQIPTRVTTHTFTADTPFIANAQKCLT
jgi:hypothetical protein